MILQTAKGLDEDPPEDKDEIVDITAPMSDYKNAYIMWQGHKMTIQRASLSHSQERSPLYSMGSFHPIEYIRGRSTIKLNLELTAGV